MSFSRVRIWIRDGPAAPSELLRIVVLRVCGCAGENVHESVAQVSFEKGQPASFVGTERDHLAKSCVARSGLDSLEEKASPKLNCLGPSLLWPASIHPTNPQLNACLSMRKK